MSPTHELLRDTTDRGEVRLLAAAARAGVSLPPRAADRLAGLAELGLRADVARRDGQATVVLSPADDLRVPADAVPPPLLAAATTLRRTLVAVLIACTERGERPACWPGRTATVAEVIAAAGVTDDARVRHTKGGLRHLERFGLVELEDDAVAETAPVRLGPAVSGWPEALLEEVDALLRAAGVLNGGAP